MRLRLQSLLPAALALLALGCASEPPRQTQAEPTATQVAALDPDRLVVVTVRNVPGPSVPRAGSTVRDYDGGGTYTVSPAARATARAIADAHKLREVSSWPIVALGVHCLVYELPAGASRGVMLESLRNDRRVESAQPLQTFDTLTSAGPGSTGLNYNDPYQRLQANLQTLGIQQAHEWSRGEGIDIAVIDTAVDVSHPDLAGRVTRQQSFLDAATAGNPIQRARHGTAVAGVIAAVANNRQGIVGIAPAAHLLAFNACWPDAADVNRSLCNSFTLAKALIAAVESRPNIINLSLAGPADPLLTRLVNYAMQRGIIVVGATTGDGQSELFPANINGVITVSSAPNGVAALREGQGINLLAPGTDVLTLVPAGNYDFQSGSSLATASVSGGIALLLARDGKLRSTEVRRLLASSSQSLMTTSGETYSINICSALASLLRQPECRSTGADNATLQTSAIP